MSFCNEISTSAPWKPSDGWMVTLVRFQCCVISFTLSSVNQGVWPLWIGGGYTMVISDENNSSLLLLLKPSSIYTSINPALTVWTIGLPDAVGNVCLRDKKYSNWTRRVAQAKQGFKKSFWYFSKTIRRAWCGLQTKPDVLCCITYIINPQVSE